MEKFVFDLQRFRSPSPISWATGTTYLILDTNNATGIANVQQVSEGAQIVAGTNVLRIVVSGSGEVKFTAGSFGDSTTVSAAAFKADDKIKEIVAKVGSASNANDFSYDNSVTYYGGGSANDKISVSSNYPDAVNIWLDGSKGVLYNSIDVVDAGNAAGSVLVAGDSSSQTIVGGKGSSTLWGGAGSAADTLKGSSGGTSMFFWGTGEGKDIVQSNSANDSVNLYSVKLADVDLTKTAITNSGVTLALNDGSMLTVQTTHDITFLVDGTSWTAQHNSKTWKQNK